MGEKIGRPLTEEVGRPRVLPKTLPVPKPAEPEKVPQDQPEKVPVRTGGESLEGALAEQAYTAAETGIQRAAKLLGISEQQVVDMIVTFADRISETMKRVGGLGKKQPLRGASHPPDCTVPALHQEENPLYLT